jgi:response regulator RpfG family c-di-GMP phosphodiesterase
MMKLAEEIAFYRHERWDGGGYNGLKGEDIPVAACIVTLADAFDVLTHDRHCRVAWPVKRAVAEIHRERGGQFDPCVVDAFLGGFSNPDLCNLRANLTDFDRAPAAEEGTRVDMGVRELGKP